MTIFNLYANAQADPSLFLQLIGTEKRDFDLLLCFFYMGIPEKLSKEQRLFAALYAEHKTLDPKATGDLLLYKNQRRDGATFLTRATNALVAAREKMNAIPSPTPQNTPPIELAPTKPAPAPRKIPTYGCQPSSPILISYRNDQGKTMHGAFYDHYTMRNITDHETQISKSPSHRIDTFTHFINHQAIFGLGIKDTKGERITPPVNDPTNDTTGLLVIPGHASDDNDIARRRHEQFLIQQARNKGQPVLAICAGSWRLWEEFGGKTKSVTGHLYSRMPSILSEGGIGYNKQIHRVALQPQTLVTGAMGLKRSTTNDRPTVNSVHWKVPNIDTLPDTLAVSAMAEADDSLEPTNRQGAMNPEVAIEAFETKYGAPMIGIQWHPEAYYKNKEAKTNDAERHLNLIRYMAKAGDAYQARKQMVVDFHEKSAQILTQQGLFKTTKENNALKPSLIKALVRKVSV